MTKKQFHQHINRSFYEMVTKAYPQYELDFNESGGIVTLIPKTGACGANMIMYHQSQHYVMAASFAFDETKQHEQEMTKWLEDFLLNTNLV